MKLSCLPVSYFGAIRKKEMTIEEWINKAASLGLDALDLSVVLFHDRDRSFQRKVQKQVASKGLGVAVMNTYPDFTHPDPVERKRQMEQFSTDLELAAGIGAQWVRITAGQSHPGLIQEQAIELVQKAFYHADKSARERGVGLLFENHSKPGVWSYPDFAMPLDIFLEIVQGISGTGIRLLFDTANPVVINEDPVALLEKMVKRVQCVHVADTQCAGKLDPCVIGRGIVPLPSIFSALKKAKYDGLLSIEEAGGCGAEGVREAVEYTRTLWRDTTTPQ